MQSVHHLVPIRTATFALAALLYGFTLTACGSVRTSSIGAESGTLYSRPIAEVEPLIRRQVARWNGTPHVLGGTSEDGIDCSAFVQRVFADALRVDLPRSTEDQVEVGRRVNMSELQAGDLVFFQPPTKTNHVGIYLDDGEFAHVSSTVGVTVSELDLPYWRTAYWTSRRVLSHAQPVAAPDELRAENVEPSAAKDAPAARVPRVGW